MNIHRFGCIRACRRLATTSRDSFASKGIEELGDSGLPLSSAERLAFPASLKTTIEAMPQTAEAEPPQLVRAGAGKASLTALGRQAASATSSYWFRSWLRHF